MASKKTLKEKIMKIVNKKIVITGATDGLGKALAHQLAENGAQLLLHGRNLNKGQQLVEELKATYNNDQIQYYNADFGDLKEIENLIAELNKDHSSIDILVNNAGLGVESKRRESNDGLEMIFQVDYLATYMMTKGLTPTIKNSGKGKIINISSAGQSALDFDDPMLEKNWDGVQSYCQAKLSQITMTKALATTLKKENIQINAIHPASYMPTKIVVGLYQPSSSIDDGITSILERIKDDEITGEYFFQTSKQQPASQALDSKAQVKLLELSNHLTGL